MSFKKNQFQRRLPPDLENGTPRAEEPIAEELHAGEEKSTDQSDESDNNDKFWKLFLEEAAAEAKWKVGIWKTELDSLLVFAGLFAAVISAFLVDLRFHLRPDPQLIALKEIVSILRNDTAPGELEHPSRAVLTAGSLWYGSLGWLGEILREIPHNPAERALNRWKRDRATKHWYMDNVITGVPLLTQAGLAMFLSGFVVQSFDDNRGIGIGVLVLCPYQTPLTKLFSANTTLDDTDTDPKIQILRSKLNRSSDDEIFCAAASILDDKLESPDSTKWYRGVERQASEIADALSVRLQSFAHRVQTITVGPTLSVLKHTAGSDTHSEDAFAGTLHSIVGQGITCIRLLSKMAEPSILSDDDKSSWITRDIDSQWRLSKLVPEACRLLLLSIHINRLVAKRADYDRDDIIEIDWEKILRGHFSDLGLRSILGASVCRGLLHGEKNVKRICAYGLAMIIEIECTSIHYVHFDMMLIETLEATTATASPEPNFFGPVDDMSKVIIERLWDELGEFLMANGMGIH
ncbi:hypothetical protein BJ912DRAFT_972510 [Pholiota molesta]|nr:hypothetical protein BJ912DRAFT_972510 [Pholiota molesta]